MTCRSTPTSFLASDVAFTFVHAAVRDPRRVEEKADT